jgi:hypothetical protein
VQSAVLAQAAAGPLCVQVTSVSDAKCTGGSCKSSQVPPAVPFPTPPSNVLIPAAGISKVTMSNGGTTSVTITLKAGVTFNYYDPLDTAMASPVGSKTATSLTVPIYTITNAVGGSCAAVGTYVFPPSSVPAKAIWNYTTLSNEGSGGIHNFPWTNSVLQATMAQIGAWAP